MILWEVMTSHIRSMSHEICWELTNKVWSLLQLIGSNEEREVSHINTLSWTSFVIVSTH
jgi:hypothetical protein